MIDPNTPPFTYSTGIPAIPARLLDILIAALRDIEIQTREYEGQSESLMLVKARIGRVARAALAAAEKE